MTGEIPYWKYSCLFYLEKKLTCISFKSILAKCEKKAHPGVDHFISQNILKTCLKTGTVWFEKLDIIIEETICKKRITFLLIFVSWEVAVYKVTSNICEAVHIGKQNEQHVKCCISIISVNLTGNKKDIALNLKTREFYLIKNKLSREPDKKNSALFIGSVLRICSIIINEDFKLYIQYE